MISKLSRPVIIASVIGALLPPVVSAAVILVLHPDLLTDPRRLGDGLLFAVLTAGLSFVAALAVFGWISRDIRRRLAGRPGLASVSSASGPTDELTDLLEEANARVRELAVLRETALDITAQLDMARLLTTIVERATKLMEVTGGIIYEADLPHRTLRLAAAVGLRLDPVGQGLAFGEGLAGRVAESGTSLVIPDYHSWPGRSRSFDDAPLFGVLSVPLHWQGQLIGVLNIEDQAGGRVFTEHDLALAEQFASQAAIAIGNARSFQAVQRQLAELDILHSVVRAEVSATQLDEVILRAMQALRARVHYDHLSLFLLEAGGQHLRLHPSFMEMFPGEPVLEQIARGQGITGRVAETGRPARLGDVAQDPHYLALFPDTRSELCVPLKLGDWVVGVLNAEANAPEAFSADDERLLTILAGILAPMIENARLVERDLRRLNELSLLTQIALATITAPDLDELLNIAVEALQQPLGYAIVGVGLLDESGNWITMHPSYRGPEGLLPLPALRGLAGAAIQSGKPVRVDDVRSDARYHMSTATTRSELAVPLKVGERVIGIINTESTWVAAYTEADEQLLTVVASLLAPIIDNARLRARAEQHARELDLLFRAQSAASASLDLGAVLTAIAEQISRALDGTSAYVCELDESGGTTVVAEWYGPAALAQERVSDLNVHYGPEMSQTAVMAIRAGRPLVTGPDDPLSTETERQRRRTFGARSMLIVPLMRQGRALGYVEVWDSRQAERVFTAGELRLAQTMAGNAAAALENAQLYLAAQRQAEQMRLINDVGRAIARILDVDSLTGQIGRSLSAAFGFYQSNVGLLDGDELVFRSHLDQRRNLMIPEARFPLDGAGIVAWVARTGQPWAAADVTRDPHFVPSPYFPATRSEAAVPLMVRDLVVGVLDVQSEQLGGLGPADLAALQAISGQLAVGIENARLFAEARHRADEVAALLATTLGLSSTLDLPTRLTIIAQHAQRLVGGDASTIYRLDDAAGCLRPIMATDDNFARDVPAANVMLGQGITGFVAQSGVAEMVNRVDLDPRAVQIPGTPLTPESVIAAPLRVGDRVTGVMAVYKDGLSDFEPHDLELITSFAAQAAVAIENVDLYQALVERAESLQAAFDELSRMDQLKDEMVQNISHELRTPITFLRSYVELLLSGDLGPLQPQQEKSLRVVANKTDTLVRLVNDIITLQAVTPATIQMVLLDLNAVAQTAADGAVAAAREAGVRFTLNLPRDPAHVRGDPLRLSQVFDNLLINAVKFSQVGDEIGLSVQLAQNVVRVEVRDTGVGISSENLNRVFDRFYQIDGTPTRRRGGLGLGLSICKLIVESHGGYMGVDSAVGYGSCFYFVLPLDNGSEAGA